VYDDYLDRGVDRKDVGLYFCGCGVETWTEEDAMANCTALQA
jgi:hypothetical protein